MYTSNQIGKTHATLEISFNLRERKSKQILYPNHST
jgi:hypothetical protein